LAKVFENTNFRHLQRKFKFTWFDSLSWRNKASVQKREIACILITKSTHCSHI